MSMIYRVSYLRAIYPELLIGKFYKLQNCKWNYTIKEYSMLTLHYQHTLLPAKHDNFKLPHLQHIHMQQKQGTNSSDIMLCIL